MPTLGNRVKMLRKMLSLKQKDLSEITGMSQGNISEIEADRKTFSYDAIVSLSGYLSTWNISLAWLLTGIGDIHIDSPKKIDKQSETTDLTVEEKLLLENYRDMTDDMKLDMQRKAAKLLAYDRRTKSTYSKNSGEDLAETRNPNAG